jgi:hypothetical protein
VSNTQFRGPFVILRLSCGTGFVRPLKNVGFAPNKPFSLPLASMKFGKALMLMRRSNLRRVWLLR